MNLSYKDVAAPCRRVRPLPLYPQSALDAREQLSTLLGSFWAFAMTKAVQARRRPVSVGPQEIIGMHGHVRGGLVAIHGELWQARSADGAPLVTGQEVVVESVDGLVLVVRPAGAPAPVA